MDDQSIAHAPTLQWILEALHAGVVIVDHRGQYRFVNAEARRLLGLGGDVTHRQIWDDLPPFGEALLARAIRTRTCVQEVAPWPGRGLSLSVAVSGEAETASLLLLDVSEREDAERRAAGLLALATTLARAATQDEVIQVVVEQALRTLDGAAGSVLLLNASRTALDLVGHVGFEQEPVGPWKSVPLEADLPVTEAVRLRHPVFVRDFEEFTRRYPETAGRVRSAYVARAALPLVADRQLLGVFALSFTTRRVFDAAEQAFLVALTGHCAQALARAAAADRSRDELERRVAERTAQLQQLSAALREQVRILEERNHETRILSKTSELLQSCLTTSEAYRVLAQQARHLLGERPGAAYAFGPSKNVLEEAVRWADIQGFAPIFTPDECWGLRQGRPFVTAGAPGEVRCAHVGENDNALCVPLLAQGEILGMLLLTNQGGTPFSERDVRVTQALAEVVGAAILNLRLRESLRQQSIRDPLTGLFNRRYLEETFERELRRAQRLQQSVGVIMLDVDHFKRFNDTHGHDAGDVLLQHFGKTLQTNVRAEDVACRYGGEEFALILPGATLDQTSARARALHKVVGALQVPYRNGSLGPVTASFGVAAYPDSGTTMTEVIQAADLALYQAKKNGRNQVQTSNSP